MAAAGVVHGQHESVRIRQLSEQRVSQVRGERGDPAVPGKMIPEHRESLDLIRAGHGDLPVVGSITRQQDWWAQGSGKRAGGG